ncbi:hypothetical protein KY343_02340 [Candidatus Woesearchaeota archaeon]|nr:hypothetical protein [Candidatus Woesearchaeota archaeon]
MEKGILGRLYDGAKKYAAIGVLAAAAFAGCDKKPDSDKSIDWKILYQMERQKNEVKSKDLAEQYRKIEAEIAEERKLNQDLEDAIKPLISGNYYGRYLDEVGEKREFLDSINSKEFKDTYDYLKTKGGVTEIKSVEDIIEIERISRHLDVLKHLVEDIGAEDIETSIEFKDGKKYIFGNILKEFADFLSSEETRDKVTSEETKNFFDYSKKKFGKEEWRIKELRRLFKFDLSDSYENIDYIIDKFDYDAKLMHHEDLLDLLDVAQDPEFMKKVRDPKYRVEDVFSTNDIVLIDLIESDEELKGLYNDRERLEKELQGIYEREPVLRTWKNKENPLPEDYSERNPLEDFSTLDLIRIYILDKAMQDPEVIKTISDGIQRDLFEFKGTELGGTFEYADGKANFKVAVPREYVKGSCEFTNGSYSHSYNGFNNRGVSTFHFHACKEDDSEISGPSCGDLSVSMKYRVSDVVITALGQEGDNMKINVDFYAADRIRGELKPYLKDVHSKAKRLDLGTYEVPFQRLEKGE